ncbi:MAG: response regulator, partial [Lachnospiraceae bacterium]|nr:response regulator [Lachnospiraceae bacterium]
MYRVMLVDDEPLILAGITSMLDWEANNYKIVGKAANGADALSQMAELQPDIVIADIKMPAMDGITLMKRAKEAGYPSVFILLTNLEECSLARESMKLDAV